jgi:hypothetical protein
MNRNFVCFYRGVKYEELHDLYIVPNIIPVIKSRRIGTGGACGRFGVRRVRTGF